MRFICIPARGGSSLAGKNMRILWGRPLLYWAIQASLSSSADIVCVSTDCREIAGYAGQFDVRVVDRPAVISDGFSASELAVNHAIDVLSIDPSETVLVQATTPTVTADDIDGLFSFLWRYDSVFLAWPTSALLWQMQPLRALNHDPSSRPMRQSRMQLQEAGCYGWRGRSKHRFFGKIGCYVTEVGIDIDSERDFIIAGSFPPPGSRHGELSHGQAPDRQEDHRPLRGERKVSIS